MASVVACAACGKKNRLPTSPAGTPVCAACNQHLPWIVDATGDGLDATVDASIPVVVDLWAPWCGPCRMVAPILEQAACDRAGRLKVVTVNLDELPGGAMRFVWVGVGGAIGSVARYGTGLVFKDSQLPSPP